MDQDFENFPEIENSKILEFRANSEGPGRIFQISRTIWTIRRDEESWQVFELFIRVNIRILPFIMSYRHS